LAHSSAAERVVNQRAVSGLGSAHVDSNELTDTGDVSIVAVGPDPIARSDVKPRQGAERWDSETMDTILDRVAEAVPVADHHGQTRGHSFHGCETEALLNVVHQKREEVCSGEGAGPQVGDP